VTKSNLYIGGMSQGFEIGGIDMSTVTRNGMPYIPASSFKGALREICKHHENNAVAALYEKYFDPEGKITKKHLFVFGVPGRNDTPKLLFNDFTCTSKSKGNNLFSIDMKNSITEIDGELLSNPRTYRVAREGLTFQSLIYFKMLDMEYSSQKLIKDYMIEMCNKFNDGFYRLGNSKSRGYGWIEVDVNDVEQRGQGS